MMLHFMEDGNLLVHSLLVRNNKLRQKKQILYNITDIWQYMAIYDHLYTSISWNLVITFLPGFCTIFCRVLHFLRLLDCKVYIQFKQSCVKSGMHLRQTDDDWRIMYYKTQMWLDMINIKRQPCLLQLSRLGRRFTPLHPPPDIVRIECCVSFIEVPLVNEGSVRICHAPVR